jgi:branched-subunit amino acid transport protein
MRKTAYQRMRYPWTDDVVSVADMQSMANDIDASLGSSFSKFGSVAVVRAALQSIPKATLTAISFDTVQLNNGGNSPLANGAWFNAAQPTRLTAISPCVVLATAFCGLNVTALGTSSCLEVTVTRNGGSGSPDIQGTKWNPISTYSGQTWANAITMWKLNAAEYLEMKVFWTGTPAGPFVTDTAIPPTLSLAMVALPAVP